MRYAGSMASAQRHAPDARDVQSERAARGERDAREAPADGFPARVGGLLCLDFANTADGRRAAQTGEYLGSYRRLVAWSQVVGTLSDGQAAALLERAAERPSLASNAYRTAISLREATYRLFSALAAHQAPQAADLDRLRHLYTIAVGAGQLVADQAGVLRWSWATEPVPHDLRWPLWPLAHSAVELATSADLLGRLKECPGGGEGPCSWLFVDQSKNASRRWCLMQSCGSIAKSRRQTQIRRAQRTRPGRAIAAPVATAGRSHSG
jgi:predicted RNA-binding Zn ribbon-like protein